MIEIDNLYCMRGSGEQAFSIHVPYLNIQSGELIAITGVSGSGKSTLLEILGLILPPQKGSLRWQLPPQRNIDINNLWQKYPEQLDGLRMRYLGFVLQTGGLLPFLTVQENIMLPKQLVQQDEGWNAELNDMVEQLDISHLLSKKPHQLSIGERQRVAIARALSHQPLLLLADEPTSALDPSRAESVMQLFVDLMRHQNRTAVIVTHDYSWIGRLGLREVKASLEAGGKIACFK